MIQADVFQNGHGRAGHLELVRVEGRGEQRPIAEEDHVAARRVDGTASGIDHTVSLPGAERQRFDVRRGSVAFGHRCEQDRFSTCDDRGIHV